MIDPKTFKTFISNGVSFQVSPLIFDPLKRADTAMFADTGKHIIINSAYRSAEKQAQLYKELKAKNPKARVALPGRSFHEKGQAIDVQNWQVAEPYLRREGFINPLNDDKVHFSIGEFFTPKNISPIILIVLIFGGYVVYKSLNPKGVNAVWKMKKETPQIYLGI